MTSNYISDGVNSDSSLPLVTPNSLILSAKGRVELQQNTSHGFIPPPHLTGYIAPEYRPNKHWTDTETEKVRQNEIDLLNVSNEPIRFENAFPLNERFFVPKLIFIWQTLSGRFNWFARKEIGGKMKDMKKNLYIRYSNIIYCRR